MVKQSHANANHQSAFQRDAHVKEQMYHVVAHVPALDIQTSVAGLALTALKKMMMMMHRILYVTLTQFSL